MPHVCDVLCMKAPDMVYGRQFLQAEKPESGGRRGDIVGEFRPDDEVAVGPPGYLLHLMGVHVRRVAFQHGPVARYGLIAVPEDQRAVLVHLGVNAGYRERPRVRQRSECAVAGDEVRPDGAAVLPLRVSEGRCDGLYPCQRADLFNTQVKYPSTAAIKDSRKGGLPA